jgi:epoxyqueuosine reductase
VCVALGNRAEAGAAPALAAALASDPAALVRMHAAWALGEIGRATAAGSAACSREEVAGALRAAVARDADGEVREEAEAALARMR